MMGKHTEDLFKTFHMKYSVFRGELTASRLKKIKQYLVEQELPYFLLITKGALE